MKTLIDQTVFNVITSSDWKRTFELNRDLQLKKRVALIEELLLRKMSDVNFGFFVEGLCIPITLVRRAYFGMQIPQAQFEEIARLWPEKLPRWKEELRNCKLEIIRELLKSSRLFRAEKHDAFPFPQGDPFSYRQNAQLMFPLPVT